MDLATIQSQGPGTDVHGLVERVAFDLYVYRLSTRDNPFENWTDAQRRVSLVARHYRHIFSSPHNYHHSLEWAADMRKTQGQEGSWYAAQNHFADLVIQCTL